MLENMLWACAFVLAGIGFYRFALPWFRRFDEKNVARIARQESETSDPNAHFRHALEVADEQVEPVETVKTGTVSHYLFEAEVYAHREEAEEARAMRVGVIARRFYEELPSALAARGSQRSKLSARERASQRWKKTIH